MTPVEVARLLAADTDEARLAHLADQGLADLAGLEWVLDRTQERVHDDPAVAADLARLCVLAAEPLGLAAVTARARYLSARVHAERGELEAALTLIEQARDGWWLAGDTTAALRTDLGRMQVLDDLGRHREAIAVGEALVMALDQTEPAQTTGSPKERQLRGWLRGAALDNLGAAHGFLGDHEQALADYARAEAAYLALDMPEEMARPLANRGIELLELGRAREALCALRSAAEAFAAAGDRLWWAKCCGHLAQAHHQLGQVTEALRLLGEATTTMAELGAHLESTRLRLVSAEVYLAVGLHGEAAAQALAVAEQAIELGATRDAGAAHYTAALARLAAQRDATEQLDAATRLFDRTGDRQYQARIRFAQAEALAAAGSETQAAAVFTEAAAALAAGGWLVPLTLAHLRLADLATDPDQAARELAAANDLVSQLGLPPLRYQHDVRLARWLRAAGDTDGAVRVLRGAVELVDRLGAQLPDHAARTAFRADKLDAHNELVELLATRAGPGDVAELRDVSDRAKAQTLHDLMTGTIGRPGATRGTRAELAALGADLNAIYGRLFAEPDPARRALLRERAGELERRVDAVRVQAAATSRSATSRATTPPDRPANPAIASATLSYHVLGDTILAVVDNAGGATHQVRLAGALPAVRVQLDRLAAQWSRFTLGTAFARRHHDTLLRTTLDILAGLDRLLYAPVRHLLPASGELRIVPHGPLNRVPFHALHDGTAHLLESVSVTVAATSAGPPVALPAVTGRDVLVLAVADADAPSVEAEAAALGALLPGARVLTGQDATATALRTHAPGTRLMHVACHGMHRAANPLFSSLRLADGALTATELLDLDLRGALVTLSACETGRHDGFAAEPLGLAWALLAAGAAGVVVSQWLVHDQTTTALMTDFYGHLRDGAQPA